MPPAARPTDPVVHPLPPVLTPGPGSLNTLIGFLPAWRGIPTAAAAGLKAAKQASDIIIQTAEAATLAAAGTPGAPAAKAAEMTVKMQQLAQMSSTIMSMAGGADIHACVTPVPPHGPGVVVDGSPTVLINNLPSARMGDTIIEALGPPNKIAMGYPTVLVGNSGSSGSKGSGSSGAIKTATATGVAVVPGTGTGGEIKPDTTSTTGTGGTDPTTPPRPPQPDSPAMAAAALVRSSFTAAPVIEVCKECEALRMATGG